MLEPNRGWASLEGRKITLRDDETDSYFTAKVRIKAVRCGKINCTRCPHHSYAYAQFRIGKKVTEKYLGVVK
ncbi:hypothetical protein ES703_65594 [subsurface metagenome]